MNKITLMKKKLYSALKWFLGKPISIKIIIIAMIFGISWFIFSRFSVNKSKQPQYQTTQAEKGTFIISITASGQVSSANNTSISTQASGVVSKVFVQNGQTVKVGDKIAELELDLDGKLRSTQAWSSYLSAKNSLDSAKTTLWTLDSSMWSVNRIFVNDALARGLLVYDPTYIQENDNWLAAEAKYINQSKVVEQVQVSLNSSWLSYQQSSPVIYAPISGTVTGLSLQKGTVLVAQSSSLGSATSQKIASIKTAAPAQLSVNLTEIDVVKIKIGDKATVTLDAFPEKTFTGKVISIDTIGSVSSGVTNYPAIIGLDTEAPEILPNMSVDAKIITKVKNDVILVSSSAVQTNNGESTVRVMKLPDLTVGVSSPHASAERNPAEAENLRIHSFDFAQDFLRRRIKNGKVEQVVVEIGDSNDTQTEIVSGVNEGDIVITSVITSTSTNNSSTSSPFGGLNRGFGGGGAVRIRD